MAKQPAITDLAVLVHAKEAVTETETEIMAMATKVPFLTRFSKDPNPYKRRRQGELKVGDTTPRPRPTFDTLVEGETTDDQ